MDFNVALLSSIGHYDVRPEPHFHITCNYMKIAFKYRTPWRLITGELIKTPSSHSSFCINEFVWSNTIFKD
jgi:hypothetical protein